MKNPHLYKVRPGHSIIVSVLNRGRKESRVDYKGQIIVVPTKNLKKLSHDHLLPS